MLLTAGLDQQSSKTALGGADRVRRQFGRLQPARLLVERGAKFSPEINSLKANQRDREVRDSVPDRGQFGSQLAVKSSQLAQQPEGRLFVRFAGRHLPVGELPHPRPAAAV